MPALTKVAVPATVPKPAAAPSKSACTSVLLPGPGVNVSEVVLSKDSPIGLPVAL